MTLSPSVLDRELLVDVAAHHFGHGWFPVPGAVGKMPALRKWAEWAALARRGGRPAWRDIEHTFRGGHVVGVGHLIVAGSCAVDVDGPAGEAVLSASPGPHHAPEVRTQHGRHLYYRGARSLPSFADLGPEIHLLGPGHYVELPPTGGKEWLRHIEDSIPRLPPHLRDLLPKKQRARVRKAAEPAADREAELAAWRDLLPDLHGNGPYRARCPLHEDERESFSVYPGARDGRLIGRCHARCGAFTVRNLRHRLGQGHVRQYTRAHEAITALGDLVDPEVTAALRWLVDRAQTYRLDLLAPEGIGASYRQLATATGVEKINNRHLSNNGQSVLRLLDRLRAQGVEIIPGKAHVAGGKGRITRVRLPLAWVTPAVDGDE